MASSLPGNSTLDQAIKKHKCIACKHFDLSALQDPCSDCYLDDAGLWNHFEPIDDTVVFAERLEARKDEK